MAHVRYPVEARLSRHVLGEREHPVRDVRAIGGLDVLVREEAVDPFRRGPESEAHLPPRGNRGCDESRLEQPLRIDDKICSEASSPSQKIRNLFLCFLSQNRFPPYPRVRDEDLVDVRRALEKGSERAFDRPREARAGESGSERLRCGKREDDVAEGREAHEKDPHPTHATLAGCWAILEPCSSLRCWF